LKNLWTDEEISNFKSDLELRVYTSNLLGRNDALVLHGGGNTSVKTVIDGENILFVKGSGWDLVSIKEEGFAPVKLDALLEMAKLESLSDSDMVKGQKDAMTDKSAPNPSVEAILHALIPFKFVDHTHADAVVTISNSKSGIENIKKVFPNFLIVPYVMPGFIMAQKIYEMSKDLDWSTCEGIILHNHGIFTFDNDVKKSYDKMIAAVTLAEEFLSENVKFVKEKVSKKKQIKVNKNSLFPPMPEAPSFPEIPEMPEMPSFPPMPPMPPMPLVMFDSLQELIEKLQELLSIEKGYEVVFKENRSDLAKMYASQKKLSDFATRGVLTPEHIIRTKRVPLIIKSEHIEKAIENYIKEYKGYFDTFAKDEICLNPAPNYIVVKDYGVLSCGKNEKEAEIVNNIVEHTMMAVLRADKLGGYKSISLKDSFEMEYWELEQVKLKDSE
jgi:rhamnose utilization protein RhaD (predicted bifunctional aldolase and dehydrogenase)